MDTILHRHHGASLLGRLSVATFWAVQALGQALVHGLTTLVVWQERVRERRRLAALDDRLLRDVGLSRADTEQEIHKPFWLG
jgi:uncharacterized protein YjiS (DUF1127 family)